MYVRPTLVGVHTSCWQTLRLASHRQILEVVEGNSTSLALGRGLCEALRGRLWARWWRSWGEVEANRGRFVGWSMRGCRKSNQTPSPVAGTPT